MPKRNGGAPKSNPTKLSAQQSGPTHVRVFGPSDGQGGVAPLPPKAVAALPSKAVTPSSAQAAEIAPTTAAPAPASEAVDDKDDDQVMLPSAWQDSTASDGACGVDCA